MSYILGALKKAERERKRDSDVAMDDWNSDDWSSRGETQNNNVWLKLFLAVIAFTLVAIFVLLWVMLNAPSDPDQLPANAIASNDVSQSSAATSNVTSAVYSNDLLAPSSQGEPQVDVIDTLQADLQDINDINEPSRPPLPKITGHLYIRDNISLNRIFLESGSYRVGESVAEGLILTEITEQLAVFEWQNDQYEVRLD